MPLMATYIKKLEGYADLEVSIIRTTKINKVLKALIKLNTIPRDEEFQFRKRSVELLSQWNKILGAEPSDEAGADKENATNGVHDEKSEDATEDDKKDEVPAPEEKPVAGTEPEKPAETAQTETPAVEEPKPAVTEESAKPEVVVPEVVDKAPASAEGAATATDIVKATE
jgi:hypothetical protein